MWAVVPSAVKLVRLDIEGLKTSEYADDIVIVTQCKFNNVAWDKMQNALQVVQEWIEYEGLTVRPTKMTLQKFSTKRRMLDGPLKLRNEEIKLCEEVKYLGVIFVFKLTWNRQPHRRVHLRLQELSSGRCARLEHNNIVHHVEGGNHESDKLESINLQRQTR